MGVCRFFCYLGNVSADLPQHFKEFLHVSGRKILEKTVIYREHECGKNEECGPEAGGVKLDSKYDTCQETGIKIQTR